MTAIHYFHCIVCTQTRSSTCIIFYIPWPTK